MIKKIYQVSLGDFSLQEGVTIEKSLVYDVYPTLAALNGNIYEKVEGLCATAAGRVRIAWGRWLFA